MLASILNGEIIRMEETFEEAADKKTASGIRSAYRDLCAARNPAETVFDIMAILLSIAVVIYVIARASMPIFGLIYDF